MKYYMDEEGDLWRTDGIHTWILQIGTQISKPPKWRLCTDAENKPNSFYIATKGYILKRVQKWQLFVELL